MTITQTITSLPTPPSSADPANFSTRADAFLGVLPTLRAEINAFAAQVNTTQEEVNTTQTQTEAIKAQAEAHAATAWASAAVAAGAANYRGDYSPTTTYTQGQGVTHGGEFFVAKKTNLNITPTSGADWLLVVRGDVLLAASQTLTNKTIAFASNTLTGVAGTAVANAFNATQTFNGAASTLATVIKNTAETTTVSAVAAAGTIPFDVLTQSVLLYTANATGNFTVNVRGSAATTLTSALAVGQSITVAFLVTNGATAFYQTGFQIDGVSITPRWQGGTAPTSGNANSVDVYAYTITKTAAAPTYLVLAAQTRFA